MYDLLWTTIARLFAKDRRPQDQRTSRRTKLVRFGLLLAVFGVVACGYVVRRHELLNINRVEVQGAVRLAPATSQPRATLSARTSSPSRGAGRTAARSPPYVQDARVAKTPPGSRTSPLSGLLRCYTSTRRAPTSWTTPVLCSNWRRAYPGCPCSSWTTRGGWSLVLGWTPNRSPSCSASTRSCRRRCIRS
ncbi:MAG: hypothetical protein WKH64_03180 [Chloroflexia bacterium]